MILDTGIIYANIDRRDDWHLTAAELISTAPGPLRVPYLVITEVCYLLGTLGDNDIATTDRRHFYAVPEARAFTLHPVV